MNAAFADTSYFLALLIPQDVKHAGARRIAETSQRPLVTTGFVVLEIANFLAGKRSRGVFDLFRKSIYADPFVTVLPVNSAPMDKGIELYLSRADKDWSLTDCTSYVVMHERGISDALTADRHFCASGVCSAAGGRERTNRVDSPERREDTHVENSISSDRPQVHGESGTHVRRFLAQRGVLILKETRGVAEIRCDFGATISITAMVLSTATGKQSRMNFGIVLRQVDSDGDDLGSVHIDFDESQELLEALDFIEVASKKMASEQRDYTEVSYVSKDEATFGFYQSDGDQKAFVKLKSHASPTFLTFRVLSNLRDAIQDTRMHLITKGAGE